jgi:hypothetical protein
VWVFFFFAIRSGRESVRICSGPPSLPELKIVRAPLLAFRWVFPASSPLWPRRSFISPTEVPPLLAVTGCCAPGHMGKNSSPSRERTRFRRLQHAWGVTRQGWVRKDRVSDGFLHREHCSPGASTPLSRHASGHSHACPRIP